MSAADQIPKRLWSVSPSAVDTFLKCKRSWYYSYVLRVDKGPTPPFLARGTSIHAAILDHWLAKGEMILEHENSDAPGVKHAVWEFTQAAKDHLPPPLTDEYWVEKRKDDKTVGLMIEQPGFLSTWVDPDGTYGPEWRQYLDLVECHKDYAIITDIKTSSDPGRYAKTPDELSHNVQLLANAFWVFSESDYKEITLRHLYLGTKTKRPKAFPVSVVVTRAHVEAEWQKILLIVREMAEWAKLAPETADPLPPNTDHCNAYSGCVFKPRCGFDNVSGLVSVRRTTMKEGEKMSLLADMMKRAGAAAKPVSGTVTPANGQPVMAVTPPAAGSLLFGKIETAKEAPPTPSKSSLLAGMLAKKADAAKGPEPLTPEKAQEAAVAAGYPVEPPKALTAGELPGYDSNGIVPPDAPSPISTPEEVAAANPEETKPAEEGDATGPAADTVEAPKRKRRTKAEMAAAKAQEEGAATEPTVLPVVDVQTAVSPEAVDQVVAEPIEESEVDKIRRILTTPDQAFACGVEALFIDCIPGKGWVGEQPTDALEFMHAFNSLAASSASAVDYRLIRYESKGYLATAIKVYLRGLPKSLYVDSRMSGADILLEILVPYARLVFRGVR